MFRWIAAAVGVFVLSIAISAASMHLDSMSTRRTFDAAGYERDRQIMLQYEAVSIMQVLATPERYDGRKVRVSGFVTLGFEDLGLHMDESAYLAGIRKNALWLDNPDWLTPKAARQLNRRYAEVAGTFKASRLGQYDLYSGTLTDLRRVVPTMTDSGYRRFRNDEWHGALMQHFLSGWFLTLVGWMALTVLWLARRPS